MWAECAFAKLARQGAVPGGFMSLRSIVEGLRARLDEKNQVREAVFARSRDLVRLCANAIRATHRADLAQARELLQRADELAAQMRRSLAEHPDIYFAGYTQDALKEYAEAHITHAVLTDAEVPSPEELGVEPAAYLNGLAEALGEIRRHVLDLIREDRLERAEEILAIMDEAYWLLMTVDFPEAVTGGLRRNTDMVRMVLERTRSDLTVAQDSARLRLALDRFKEHMRGGD